VNRCFCYSGVAHPMPRPIRWLTSVVLAQKEIAELRAANKAATRRRSYKRKRIQVEGTLLAKDRARLTALKEFRARSNRKKLKTRVRAKVGKLS
jgi:hypothetical protein